MGAATGAFSPTRLREQFASDERLVARVRAGDARAFEAMYDRYERPIRSFCRHLLGQPEDADDAVQHTFLAAYRAIRGGDQAIDLRPWLFTIARNRCRSMLRSRRNDPWPAAEQPEPSTEGLVAAVERREALSDLLRDIAGLPEDQRAALILTQLETLQHDEVARVLDVPTEKVKALVYQARSSLISTRRARETTCHEIREQLATLSGPALRRTHLRRHLRECTGCRDFQIALRRQRAAITVLLPLLAKPDLRGRVLAELAAGGSGAAGASAGALSGIPAGGAVLKIAVAVCVAGAGVAGVGTQALKSGGAPRLERVDAESHLVARAVPSSSVRAAMHTGRSRLGAATPEHHGGKVVRRVPTRDRTTAGSTESSGQNEPMRLTTPTGSSGPAATSEQTTSVPPGLANQGGSPPGLAKGGDAPQAKEHTPGADHSHGKKGQPPGQAKHDDPAASGAPAPSATLAPPSPPPGNGNSHVNGNGGGNGHSDGNGNGHGHGHGGP